MYKCVPCNSEITISNKENHEKTEFLKNNSTKTCL